MSGVTVDATTERPSDEVIELAGSGLVLRWLPLSEGRARADVINLNGLLRALLEQRDLPGGVLVAVEPCGQVVGAAVLCLGGGGANAAVAVVDRWQARGLGRELARRVVASAKAAGHQHLSCRSDRHPEDVDRAASLFGQTCVSSARVGFHHVLVMRLNDERDGAAQVSRSSTGE